MSEDVGHDGPADNKTDDKTKIMAGIAGGTIGVAVALVALNRTQLVTALFVVVGIAVWLAFLPIWSWWRGWKVALVAVISLAALTTGGLRLFASESQASSGGLNVSASGGPNVSASAPHTPSEPVTTGSPSPSTPQPPAPTPTPTVTSSRSQSPTSVPPPPARSSITIGEHARQSSTCVTLQGSGTAPEGKSIVLAVRREGHTNYTFVKATESDNEWQGTFGLGLPSEESADGKSYSIEVLLVDAEIVTEKISKSTVTWGWFWASHPRGAQVVDSTAIQRNSDYDC